MLFQLDSRPLFLLRVAELLGELCYESIPYSRDIVVGIVLDQAVDPSSHVPDPSFYFGSFDVGESVTNFPDRGVESSDLVVEG